MADKFTDALLTPKETARHLRIPKSTVYSWLAEQADGSPLVHGVQPAKQGWPSVPFIAVVETYVLRSLRDLQLSKQAIRDAAVAVRREFGTPYGLATRRIATDGVDIFVEYADSGDLARARDRQRPFREIIDSYLRYIAWDQDDDFPGRLRLRQYAEAAPVSIDPEFGWGSPVVEANKVPVQAIVELWQSGEPLEVVAEEYGLSRKTVEEICRVAAYDAA